MNRVFVYGTLKRGQRNFHFLRHAEFVAEFTTGRIYSMYQFDDYPAVCLNGRQAIRGEIYQVTDRQFKALDDLEAEPALPHARLPDDAHYLSVTRRSTLEGELESGHLITAANELGEATGS